MFYFDPLYFVFLIPALVLALWAQWRVKAAYAAAQQQPARLSGAEAAELVLRSGGVPTDVVEHSGGSGGVRIEMIPGQLTDHYDPRDRVLRLSPEVYQSRSLAAVGIAAHEAGHALQHAHGYAPLAVRSLVVPVANFGGGISPILFILGMLFHMPMLIWAGVLLFSGVVFFQLINLPVEFNASNRAKDELLRLGVVDGQQMPYVNGVLNAAAWTYVAGTLQAVMTLLYYLLRASGSRR